MGPFTPVTGGAENSHQSHPVGGAGAVLLERSTTLAEKNVLAAGPGRCQDLPENLTRISGSAGQVSLPLSVSPSVLRGLTVTHSTAEHLGLPVPVLEPPGPSCFKMWRQICAGWRGRVRAVRGAACPVCSGGRAGGHHSAAVSENTPSIFYRVLASAGPGSGIMRGVFRQSKSGFKSYQEISLGPGGALKPSPAFLILLANASPAPGAVPGPGGSALRV
ncbi:uncharacterized protein LOC125089873 [Lutra lutra]|uniref:uncharacterized protein LOC125089873 n=1 Tax=Lutra lutra TaxID=9657 RepID=UPI001FD2C385|nr:uncharacterized protein LOC125089873 [Lutra lutra]